MNGDADARIDAAAIDTASCEVLLAARRIGRDAAKRDALREIVRAHNAARTQADLKEVARRARAIT